MSRHKEGCSNTALNRKKMGVSVFAVAFLIYKLYKMLVSKGLLPPTDVNEKFRFELLRSKLLPQFCKHSESVDLLHKSLLPHVWRVPSSKALSCKHERLFDLLTLASSYSFTAPAVNPSIKNFDAHRKQTRSGSTAQVLANIIAP